MSLPIRMLRNTIAIRRDDIIDDCDAVFPLDPFVLWEPRDSGWALALGIAKPFPPKEILESVGRRAMKRIEDQIARAVLFG